MNVPAFNATMAPNGMMIVWTGALLRMRDEAELAFVLGHEFGHFRAQHTLQQWRRMKDTSAFLERLPGARLWRRHAGYGDARRSSPAMRRCSSSAATWSAKPTGSASTPWSPKATTRNAGADLWERMLREENTRRYASRSTVFATHPATQERLDDVRAAAAARRRVRRTNAQRRAYRAATRPFLEHWLEARTRAAPLRRVRMLVIGELLADAPPRRSRRC